MRDKQKKKRRERTQHKRKKRESVYLTTTNLAADGTPVSDQWIEKERR